MTTTREVPVETPGGRPGAVTGTVHGGVHDYYRVPADASPREKLAIALRYLESGQATTARRLFAEIVAHIGTEPYVWFHWLLAFLSGRTLWELSAEERLKLTATRELIHGLKPDRWWSRGIAVIERLVDATAAHAPDAAAVSATLAELDALDPGMRTSIARHLERVVQGPLKDELWAQEVEDARAARTAGRRTERVWKFFEPDPAPPRARPVRPARVSRAHLALAALTTVIAAGAACVLGWLGLQRDDPSAVIAVAVGLGAAGAALVNGAEWRFRSRRRAPRPSHAGPPAGGFAGRVDRMYRRYVRLAVPDPAERAAWLREAYRPMCRLRDELAEVYREARVSADEVRWLIRFQVRELRRQWRAGTRADECRRWAVAPAVKGVCVGGTGLAAASLLWAAQAAARQDLRLTLGAAFAVVVAGWLAAEAGVRIGAENRRVAVDTEDRRVRLNAYWFEWQRWGHRLDDRPTDMEMAQWLDCDRRILVDLALRAYHLRWGDVCAYASVEAGRAGSSRARARNGPWRYSKYRLLAFLLTTDGVRQVTVELDLAQATFHEWQRRE
ncbi:hypothetical protein [Actinoplanes sp. NPDC049265]|uniref:hypothetical protein n=1 Tax=Actinoplanes sp. NPDC049265 TaxID=3363902 RepID=UPI00371AEBBB